MHGKLFREWVLFLKEKKMYSRFVIHYRAANISARTWEREKPSFKLFNGVDYILPNKSDTLSFELFLFGMRIIDWYETPSYYDWSNLAIEFGETNGYLERRNPNYHYGIYYAEESSSSGKTTTATVYRAKERHSQKEAYGKWYDRFCGRTIKNRYRR